ncbi:FMN-binding protein [Patescibacteria group bacterium]|nr:FMN-binding protein [Patescibacteria group bacterium]
MPIGKKLMLSAGLIVVSAAYAVYLRVVSPASSAAAVLPSVANQSGVVQIEPAPAPAQPTAAEPAPTPVSAAAPVKKAAGQYADGSYTGGAVDAYYGIVQVKAIVSGGKLTDIQFLQYPNDRDHTRELSFYAMPLLKQEAISAQNAQVDSISGATATSEGFSQSLSSALARAKN